MKPAWAQLAGVRRARQRRRLATPTTGAASIIAIAAAVAEKKRGRYLRRVGTFVGKLGGRAVAGLASCDVGGAAGVAGGRNRLERVVRELMRGRGAGYARRRRRRTAVRIRRCEGEDGPAGVGWVAVASGERQADVRRREARRDRQADGGGGGGGGLEALGGEAERVQVVGQIGVVRRHRRFLRVDDGRRVFRAALADGAAHYRVDQEGFRELLGGRISGGQRRRVRRHFVPIDGRRCDDEKFALRTRKNEGKKKKKKKAGMKARSWLAEPLAGCEWRRRGRKCGPPMAATPLVRAREMGSARIATRY